ncbi:MAG: M28 family peptidase [Spirochaetales bacterium]|nr:M28 family peptidase [Spirochaetales bacterium]
MRRPALPAGAPTGGRAARALEAIHAVFGALERLPDRASGTYHERRAARLLSELADARLNGAAPGGASPGDASPDGAARRFRLGHQGFAVDLSSGAMNVAAHGALLLALTVFPLLSGALRAAFGELGPESLARFGPLFALPASSLAFAAAGALLLFVARFLPGAFGWSIFSFLVPNLESGNVIVDDLPVVPRVPVAETKGGTFDVEVRRWKDRFAAARAGAEETAPHGRLVVLAAHYDSARALPGDGFLTKRRFFAAILKTGFAVVPALAYFACVLVLGFFALAALAPDSSLASWAVSWPGWAAIGLLAFGLGFSGLEMAMAMKSSNLPYVQGYNDNLSGVAAALACLEDLASGPPLPGNPAFMLALTGSEENGLHGSIAFARRTLRHAVAEFGAENVSVWNFESVSGARLRATCAERTFSGFVRSGDPEFAREYAASLPSAGAPAAGTAPLYAGAPTLDGTWAMPLEVCFEPMAACTDLTGFTAPRAFRKRLRILTFSAPERTGMEKPRDYHRLEDDAENAEGYTDSIAAAALLVADAVRSGL